MEAQKLFQLIPGLSHEEFEALRPLVKDLPEEQLTTFASLYNSKRRTPDTILIGGVLGLFLVAGVQRFMVNQIGMGILYLLTGGLCFIGTIYDLVNYRNLALEYNRSMAIESQRMTQAYNG